MVMPIAIYTETGFAHRCRERGGDNKMRAIVENIQMSGVEGVDSDGNNVIWLLYRGQLIPRDVSHVRIDPSVNVILPGHAFEGSKQLVEVELCEGIERIGAAAFQNCKSLKYISKVPSSLKVIDGSHTFNNCEQLVEVELCEGLEDIGWAAFYRCKSLRRVNLPSTVKKIGTQTFYDCQQLIDFVLCDGIERINKCAFQNCFSLRNVAVPTKTQTEQCFGGCHDLLKLFGSDQMIIDALKSRFDELPIHRLCYYQSYHPTQMTIDQLNDIITEQNEASLDVCNNQDCLGMTPLHILACSTKQNLELYQFIVASEPTSLIAEDKWGCLPILYAIWSSAPPETLQLLIDDQKSAFPNYIYDWGKMIETVCRAGVSLDIVKRLLDTHQASFSEQIIDWQTVARELTIRFFVERDYGIKWERTFFDDWRVMVEALNTSSAHQEVIQSLLAIQQQYFDDQSEAAEDLQMVCEELVQPLTGWWRSQKTYRSMQSFQFLVKCTIPERLNALGIRKWQMKVKNLVEKISSITKQVDFEAQVDTIHSKLISYERLKDATYLLEMALWKSKIDESMQNHDDFGQNEQMEDIAAAMRRECLINCGADVIIPNVLSYLIAEE